MPRSSPCARWSRSTPRPSSPRSRRRAGFSRWRRTRGCAAGARRSHRSSPMRASTASTHRSSGSPRRTSRCRRRRRSRTSRCRPSTASSRPCGDGWTTPRDRHERSAAPSMTAPTALTAAVLGTGRMGSAMAERLAGQGVDVVVYNRTPDRATALGERIGGSGATTPAEAASRADVIITMVADDAAVREMFEGADGIAAGIRDGAVAVDMSTVLPDTIRAIAPAVHARGAGILDGPVSGSVSSTLAGELTVMVGGDAGDLERARPVLDRLARRVFHLGPLGSGAVMKLAVNTLIFGLNGAVAEGLVLAERNGIDRALAYEVLASSAAGAPMVGYKRANFGEPETTPVAFSLALADKDLRLIRQLADASETTMPQATVNLDTIQAAEPSAGAELDFSMVASHLRQEGRR